MYKKLLFVLLCLVITSMLITGSVLPVYADGGENHGNHGDQGGGPGGNGQGNNPHSDNRSGGNHWQEGSNNPMFRSDNMTPPWGGPPHSDNMTGPWPRRDGQPPSDNWTEPRPRRDGSHPSDNMTPPSDNITRHEPPWDDKRFSDNVTDNDTDHRPPHWRGSDNTSSPLSKLAQILNIDESTLINALKQVFGDFIK
ncbi:MAG: hypothetical protein ABSA18_03350 [Dehalococcoidia bacterium]